MVRRTVSLAFVFGLGVGGAAGTACTGSIDQGEQVANLTPAQQLAQTAWLKKALPALKAGTCNTCHDGSMAAAPAYMAGEKDLDIRDGMLAFIPAVVNLNSPQSSRVVVKAPHEGPALSAPQASDVVQWLQAERDARPAGTEIQTPQMMPMMCITPPCPLNTIDLSGVGSTGSSISFEVTPLGADLYFTALKVTAGPSGLSMVHPVFETWPPAATMPTLDPNDRFFSVSLNLAANAMATLGMGETTFMNFGTNPISVKFDVLSTKM